MRASAYEDDDPDPDEPRYNRICRIEVGDVEHMLFITYTERYGRNRIISARRTDKHEQAICFAPDRP